MTGTRDTQQDGSIQAMLRDSGLEAAPELRNTLEQLKALGPATGTRTPGRPRRTAGRRSARPGAPCPIDDDGTPHGHIREGFRR